MTRRSVIHDIIRHFVDSTSDANAKNIDATLAECM
jgi:hypothetical protein